MSKPTNQRNTLASPSERPDLYDGYDGVQHSAANPVRMPDRLAKMLEEHRSQTSDASDVARTAIRSLEDNAAEMQQMFESILDTMHQVLKKLRAAKSTEEIVSIQASYLRLSSTNTADYTRRLGALMAPMEFARQARATSSEDSDGASNATKQTGSAL